MHKKRVVVAASTAALAVLAAGAGPAAADVKPLSETGVLRMFGADRFATAVDISKRTFTTPQQVVYIASGEYFPDALSGGPLAASKGAPVLPVRASGLPAVVATELQRLKPAEIVILGGTAVVPTAVEDALKKNNSTATVTRIAGADRYSTSAKVAAKLPSGSVKTVYLSSGEGFADALAGGAAAAAEHGALLLTAKNRLPSVTTSALKSLKPTSVVILGGTGAISAAVESSVKAALPGVVIDRANGRDRYETAAMVASALWGETGSRDVFLASGDNFPDALAATPSAYVNDAPILLTRGTCTPLVTALTHDDLAPDLTVFLGGKTVTSDGAKVC